MSLRRLITEAPASGPLADQLRDLGVGAFTARSVADCRRGLVKRSQLRARFLTARRTLFVADAFLPPEHLEQVVRKDFLTLTILGAMAGNLAGLLGMVESGSFTTLGDCLLWGVAIGAMAGVIVSMTRHRRAIRAQRLTPSEQMARYKALSEEIEHASVLDWTETSLAGLGPDIKVPAYARRLANSIAFRSPAAELVVQRRGSTDFFLVARLGDESYSLAAWNEDDGWRIA